MAPIRYKPLNLISMSILHASTPATATLKTEEPTSTLPVPAVHSAASEAFGMFHIRQQVLSYLREPELAVMMRVEKDLMGEVAELLYREVTYGRVMVCMIGSSFQRDYLKAVRIIDAYDVIMPYAMQQHLGICPSSPFDNGLSLLTKPTDPECFRHYRPEFVVPIITPLKAVCPGLTEIRFGEQHRGPGEKAWIVHFSRIKRKDQGAISLGRGTDGHTPSYHVHIEHLESTQIYLFSTPPTEMEAIPPPPSPTHTQTARFDLDLDTWYKGVELKSGFFDSNKWRDALHDTALFAELYRLIDFGQLELTLDEITHLYTRQILADHKDRLAYIRARYIIPFNIDSFVSFSQIASTSLVSLRLAERYSDHLDVISFDSLPDLILAISKYLPNLDTLHIAMQGIDSAKAISWKMLCNKPIDLNKRGNLQFLRIHTASSSTDLFSTIRCISGLMCGLPYVPILHIGPSAGEVFKWNSHDQRKYLMYLKSQPPSRQYHIAKVDFTTLDINTVDEACELGYAKDGRPQHRWRTQAAALAQKALGDKDYPFFEFVPSTPRTALGEIGANSKGWHRHGRGHGKKSRPAKAVGEPEFGGW